MKASRKTPCDSLDIKVDFFGRGSPGLVVMGGDLCSEGRGFKSQRCILDGYNLNSHIFVVRIVCLKR